MKDEVRAFLVSRRGNLSPDQVGLLAGGGERRVSGLRREEVALLAGVSVDYYTKLERGKIKNASEGVLDAVAEALRLNEVERAHLFDLFRAQLRTPPAAPGLRRSLQRLLDTMNTPAIASDARQDVLGANALGRAMFSPLFDSEHPNFSRFIFLDPRARTFFGDWDLACRLNAAMLRLAAGRNPLDTRLTALIGELSTRSPTFRQHWADQDVHEHRTGTKSYHHPDFGPLETTYDVLDVPGEPGLSLTTYTALENSPTAAAFVAMASYCRQAEQSRRQRSAAAVARATPITPATMRTTPAPPT